MMENPLPTNPTSPGPIDMSAYDKETQLLEKRGRLMAGISSTLAVGFRLLTFLMQIAVMGTSAASLQQFYKSRYYTDGSQPLWSSATFTWPTILTLIAALVIGIFNGIVLGAYCFRKFVMERWVKSEAFANAIQGTLSTIAAGIMLGTSANPDSLEGQSCGISAATQTTTGVNTSAICTMQQFMQYTMLIQVWLGTLNTFKYGWGWIVDRHKKKVQRHDSQGPKSNPNAEANGKEK